MRNKIKNCFQAEVVFDALNVIETTSKTQKKNGTRCFELPNRQVHVNGRQTKLRFAIYKSGYVRNLSGGMCYQLNRICKVEKKHVYQRVLHGEIVTIHRNYMSSNRVLIDSAEERMVYLANFICRNYYSKKYGLVNSYTSNNISRDRLISMRQERRMMISGLYGA